MGITKTPAIPNEINMSEPHDKNDTANRIREKINGQGKVHTERANFGSPLESDDSESSCSSSDDHDRTMRRDCSSSDTDCEANGQTIPEDTNKEGEDKVIGKPRRVDSISTSSVSSLNTDFSVSFNSQLSMDMTDFRNVSLDSESSVSEIGTSKKDTDGPITTIARTFFRKKSDVTEKNSEETSSTPDIVQSEEENRIGELKVAKDSANQNNNVKRKSGDVEVPSTTALILEQRPINLPSKPEEEREKHKKQYEDMIAAAKKKEQKELKLKKKQYAQQIKHEEELHQALKVWHSEILPHWHSMRDTKKSRDLWWKGVPPAVRGKIWQLAIGNDLNITPELFEICRNRARDLLKALNLQTEFRCDCGNDELAACKEQSLELIKLDVSRTFPQLCIFQKGGPYAEHLHSLLAAYACYRPDVGYVQGMSFIAAFLLLNMEVEDAFISFANLLNRPCQVAFFRLDEPLMKSYFDVYSMFFRENLPKLYKHFELYKLTPDLYLIDWIFTLYSKSLPLDVASRVWDVFYRDGEEFLFRTALGIMKYNEDIFYGMDFIHAAQFLTHLPDDIDCERMFKCIESIHMQIEKRKFPSFLAAIQRNISSANQNVQQSNSAADSASISSRNSNYSQREGTSGNGS
ncbi:DgyrCDS6829 [Dimorphilus gyrociliatus]|uniref:DgyrCDS6829 n=1 Tax=Dimorphilus gyrociliatus TaxID=2664684 RepID=A0A7I8VP59_9ANNE|nr:DgyrCDS6829 [Dimorphilus gyrociliatus]